MTVNLKCVLGIVTARGGSKRLPRKNLQYINGVSLVRRAYDTLSLLRQRHPELALRLSTDSQEIADQWPEKDRPERLRSDYLSSDAAKSIDVVMDEAHRFGDDYDAVILVQPTSPLVTVEDLEALWAGIESGRASMVGVTRQTKPSSWIMRIMDHTHQLHEGPGMRGPNRDHDCHTDDRMVEYMPMGIYAATRAFLLARNTFYHAGDSYPVIVPPERAVDIDTQMDLDHARFLVEQADTMIHNTVTTDCL